jgi:uncharacterized protein (DUF1697 family)
MPSLRQHLTEAGFEGVRTYLASGNVVLDSESAPEQLERKIERLITDRFGLEIDVVVRSRDELAAVVELNPLGAVADNPKLYQVSFLSGVLDPGIIDQLRELAAPSEQVVAIGRELYAWHPDGVARSKLWTRLAGRKLGVTATARNWTTVTSLLTMAEA